VETTTLPVVEEADRTTFKQIGVPLQQVQADLVVAVQVELEEQPYLPMELQTQVVEVEAPAVKLVTTTVVMEALVSLS